MLGIIAKPTLQQRVLSLFSRRLGVVVVLVIMLAGCSGGSYAPVSDRNVTTEKKPRIFTVKNTPRATQQFYRVQTGDTLFSIAFRYGKDYKQLASDNDIDSSYKIYPGQLINLIASGRKPQNINNSSKKRSISSKRPLKETAKVASSPTPAAKIEWAWPVKGKVIQGFSDKGILNKGINISAPLGQPVYAAASGEVVYAGSGLLGYGNLIIVKHNSDYLSAYAHNSRLLVKENDRVKQGEEIANVGNSGAVRPMLHFEIRKDGKPVNPLKYLP